MPVYPVFSSTQSIKTQRSRSFPLSACKIHLNCIAPFMPPQMHLYTKYHILNENHQIKNKKQPITIRVPAWVLISDIILGYFGPSILVFYHRPMKEGLGLSLYMAYSELKSPPISPLHLLQNFTTCQINFWIPLYHLINFQRFRSMTW